MSEEELYNYINEIQKYLRDITQDVSKKDTLNADIKNIKYLLNKIAMAFQIEKIDNKYNQEEASEEIVRLQEENEQLKEEIKDLIEENHKHIDYIASMKKKQEDKIREALDYIVENSFQDTTGVVLNLQDESYWELWKLLKGE